MLNRPNIPACMKLTLARARPVRPSALARVTDLTDERMVAPVIPPWIVLGPDISGPSTIRGRFPVYVEKSEKSAV